MKYPVIQFDSKDHIVSDINNLKIKRTQYKLSKQCGVAI